MTSHVAGPVTVAVIPAAGRGTRFLPFTKAVPKELLPLGAMPAMHYAVRECIEAGIDHIVLVTSRDKPALASYFEPDQALSDELRDSGNDAAAAAVEQLGRVRVSVVYQDLPRGLGHAVGCARDVVGDQPFAVLLPDEVMGGGSLLRRMIDVCASTGGGVVGMLDVPRDQVSRYGVLSPAGPIANGGVMPVASMVEKPPAAEAPSTYIIIGRYVLTADVFDEIAGAQPGALGEIQLTDALRAQAGRGPFHGVLCDISRHDTGNPVGWFEAVVDAMLGDSRYAAGAQQVIDARATR